MAFTKFNEAYNEVGTSLKLREGNMIVIMFLAMIQTPELNKLQAKNA
jgi:hypothetical protein